MRTEASSPRRTSPPRAATLAAVVYRAAVAATAVVVAAQLYAWQRQPLTPAVAFIEADQTFTDDEAEEIRRDIASPASIQSAWRQLGWATSDRSPPTRVRTLSAPEGKSRWAAAVAMRDGDEAAALAATLARGFVQRRSADSLADALNSTGPWRNAASAVRASLAELLQDLEQVQQQISELRPAAEQLRTQGERVMEGGLVARANKSADDPQPIAVRSDPSTLTLLEERRTELAARLTPRHPELAEVDRHLDELRRETPEPVVASDPAPKEASDARIPLVADAVHFAGFVMQIVDQADLRDLSDVLGDAVMQLRTAAEESPSRVAVFREVVLPTKPQQAGPAVGTPTFAAAGLLGLIAAACGAGAATSRVQQLAASVDAPLLGVVRARACGWRPRRGLPMPTRRTFGWLLMTSSHVVVIVGAVLLATQATAN